MDTDLFIASFLGPLQPYQGQIGTLIFEFSHFHPGDLDRGRQFVEALDSFLARLPRGWNYSVEIRNANFLHPDYFAILRRHGVAHTFNNWSRMPSTAEQIEIPGSFTADFATARFLLKPGRSYEQAVKEFQPYAEVKEPSLEARQALIDLLTTPAKPGRPNGRFLYVNNRLEGCALWTIYAAISVATVRNFCRKHQEEAKRVRAQIEGGAGVEQNSTPASTVAAKEDRPPLTSEPGKRGPRPARDNF